MRGLLFFLFFLLTIGVTTFLIYPEEKHISNEHVFIVLSNSDDGTYHVILQRRLESGELSDVVFDKVLVSHAKNQIEVEQGVYHITILNEKGMEIHQFEDYSFIDHYLGESDPPYYVNITRKSNFVVADLDFLYQSKLLPYSSVKIVKMYDGSKPFQLGKKYVSSKILDGNNEIPHKKHTNGHVYALYEVPDLISNNNLETYIAEQVKNHYEH